MPLHLLGKKSWNVYNTDNIERVRRDEAAAKAAEQEEERRMQDVDSQRRLAILRGQEPVPIESNKESEEAASTRHSSSHPQRSSHVRKRKRPGEDDTEFELRVAKERNVDGQTARSLLKHPTSSAPLVDHSGHIDLFGENVLGAKPEKNEEAEKEKRKKEREFEDQYTMRFSNAAGRDGHKKPWYSNAQGPVEDPGPMKDVWGNNDPKRRERDTQRTVSSDPLAMMKRGAAQVRQLKKERQVQVEERAQELRELRKETERDSNRHSHRHRHGHRRRSQSPRHRKHRDREDRHDHGSKDHRAEDNRRRSKSPHRKHHRHERGHEGHM